MEHPTKTFGLASPMDVFLKLEFDLERLREARYTKQVQFSSLDLAVWSYHMIDWVLNAVDDKKHQELTGKLRDGKGVISGFVTKQFDRLGTLAVCGQIANTGKHRVLTRQADDPTLETRHTVTFDPPFVAGQPYNGKISARAYLVDLETGQKMGAIEFFHGVVEQWREFLKVEDLYDWDYNYEPPETADLDQSEAAADGSPP